MENINNKSNSELEAILNNYVNEDLEHVQQAATEFRNRGNGVLNATIIAKHFGLNDVSDLFKYENTQNLISNKNKETKQSQAIRESFRQLAIGHTMQFVAFLIIIIVFCIVYFKTQETVNNFSIYNLQDSSDKLTNNLKLIKYAGVISFLILMFSSFYLAKVSVEPVEEDIP